MCYKCNECGKEFETPEALKGHRGSCKVGRQKLEAALPKEVLYDLMFNKEYSAKYIGTVWLPENHDIKRYAGCIIKLAQHYGFKTRGVEEANATPLRSQMIRETNLKKYGVENVSQAKEIKEKKEQTFLKHYGIKNIFEDGDYIKECFFKKHGVYNPMHIEGITRNNCYGYKSKLQERVEHILERLNINFVSDTVGKFLKYNEELKRNYNPRPDILIEDKKIIIEVQGDHWHANPKFFKPTDLITWLWKDDCTAADIWKKDDIRKRHLESFGYKVYFLWGDDILHNIKEVEDNIKKWLDYEEQPASCENKVDKED